MPKRKRRDQQHLRQQPARRTAYRVGGTAPAEKYRPGFPMSLLGNIRFFSIVGVVVAVLLVLGAVLTRNQNPNAAVDLPTPTPTAVTTPTETPDPNKTPEPTPTPTVKTFAQAEKVIDAATKQYSATVKTDKGDIVLKLNADVAPNTVNSFVFLAQQGYFDGITFHRVPQPPFVAQSGDPTGTGSGGPGYSTADEPNQVSNRRGTVAMAKSQRATSFGSQWFINLKNNPALDFSATSGDKFYPFAEVTAGMDVADRLVQGDRIVSVTVTESPK